MCLSLLKQIPVQPRFSFKIFNICFLVFPPSLFAYHFLLPLFQATLIFSDLRSSSQLPVPLLPPLFLLMPLLLHQHLPSPNLTFLSQTQVTSNISPKFCSPMFSSSVLVSLSLSLFSYFLLHLLFSALPLFFLRYSEGLAGIRCRNHPCPPAE